MKDLHKELSKAKEAAQLIKEAAEAEKQASYALGEESQNLGALGGRNHNRCSQVVLGWNQQGPQRHQGLYLK